jgi:hypothetical protein
VCVPVARPLCDHLPGSIGFSSPCRGVFLRNPSTPSVVWTETLKGSHAYRPGDNKVVTERAGTRRNTAERPRPDQPYVGDNPD